PSCMFVTLIHGIYHPASGEVVLASGGHPPPLLRRADGAVEVLPLKNGRLLGYEADGWQGDDHRCTLGPGELLFLYTDGLSEARVPGSKELFGIPRMRELVTAFTHNMPLAQAADLARQKAESFTGSPDLHDDLTVLLLRRDFED